MLVENTEPRARTLGPIVLKPGVNEVGDDLWEKQASSPQWKNVITGLVKHGVIKTRNSSLKLTEEVILGTYDIDLLNKWHDDSSIKGKLRKAVEAQIEKVAIEDI